MIHIVRALALLTVIAISPAYAENTLPEVVVTATLRQDSTMDTASSVSVVSEEVIRARAAQHFEDIINVNY